MRVWLTSAGWGSVLSGVATQFVARLPSKHAAVPLVGLSWLDRVAAICFAGNGAFVALLKMEISANARGDVGVAPGYG